MIYAQLNENSICISVTQLSGEVTADNLIQIETYNMSLLGKKYNNGEWEDIQKEPEPEEPTIPEPIPQPTEQDLLNAEILLNQTEQSAKLKQIDEAIAVLLMNQTGGM